MNKLIVFAVVAIMFELSGCNTIQGMGKDIEKAGEAVQKSTK